MQKGKIVTKASPWMVEGVGQKHVEVRYVGIKSADWEELFPSTNNFLLKFIYTKPSARIEYYIANTPPFFKFYSAHFSESAKWETLLGGLKRQLKKDKAAYQNHQSAVGNLYELIKPYLK